MPNNKPRKPKKQETSFTYPKLHEKVIEAVPTQIGNTPWFNHRGDQQEPSKEWETNVMGRFHCINGCAQTTWTSKKVSIVIRGYNGNGYDAIVFNQRCKFCKGLGKFTLDQQSYIERISYRLQRWAGLDVEQPPYDEKEGPPHVKELCEGCKRGYCKKKNWSIY
jgi:hypothetical protein